MLKFNHPDLLWLLLALPVLAVGQWLLLRTKRRLLHRVIGAGLTDLLAPEWSPAKQWLKHGLLQAALACFVLALADPLVGTRLEEIKREGIDLFVALDVSMSMKAEDIKPSRLEKAKRDVSALLKKLAGDRVGLIVFAGDAFVQFPLTADYAAADLFISTADVESVPTPGTMMASAIERALNSFPADVPTKKAIVVVSDGENNEGDVLGAVEEARKANVRVFTIGMGTAEGGPIPVFDAAGNRVDYKRDRSGSIVLTKLDESTLQQIAASTGGSYRRASSGGNEIDEVFKELAAIEKTEFGVRQVSGYESRYQYPLAWALLLLMLEALLSERSGSVGAWFRRLLPRLLPGTAVLLLALCAAAPMHAQTVRGHISDGNRAYDKGNYTDAEVAYRKALEKNPKSREGQYNLGNAQYKQQRFEDALREYNNAALASKDPAERSAAYYNLGNTLYRSNKFPESIEAYKQALRLNPADEDARYNLQMAREKLKQQQQQKNQQDKQDQKQNDQKQQQQQQNQQQDQQKNQQNQQQQPQQQQNQESKQDQTRQQQIQRKNQMPKQEAERILEALRNNEKDVQKKMQKREAVRVRVDKDW